MKFSALGILCLALTACNQNTSKPKSPCESGEESATKKEHVEKEKTHETPKTERHSIQKEEEPRGGMMPEMPEMGPMEEPEAFPPSGKPIAFDDFE